MKYANLRYSPRNGRLNLGDDMQLLAVDNLYQFMGIGKDEIANVNYGDLTTYNGDYVVLPIAFPLLAYTKSGDITCFSDRIIPVFLSVCILASSLSDNDVAYLKRYAPIGCRDLHTLTTMRSYGIPSYLNGCITLGFPNRWNGGNGKVFLVDISDQILQIIPKDLLDKSVIRTQIYEENELHCEPKEAIAEIYEQYISEAELVITSRLHCALPCFAAGIPTIFLKDSFSYRFAGVDAVIPVYTRDNYASIDWNPKPLDINSHKTEMLSCCAKRLRDAFERYEPLYSLSMRLENNERPDDYFEYITDTEQELQKKYAENNKLDCIIWGVTQTASLIYSYIKENLPGANIRAIIDNGFRRSFYEFDTVSMDFVDSETASSSFLIVCTASAVQDARAFAQKHNCEQVLFCCDTSSPRRK